MVGPQSAAYWSSVSPEVFVRVEPDGYDYKYRTKNLEEWSYRAQGLSDLDIKHLLTLTAPPSKRSRYYVLFQTALESQNKLLSLSESCEVIRGETTPVTILADTDEAIKFLGSLEGSELVALDFEWKISGKDKELRHNQPLIGVNVSTTDGNWYIPIRGRTPEGEVFDRSDRQQDVRDATFRLVRSTKTIWHNAKADFNSQYVGDPLELADAPYQDTILMAYVCGDQGLGLKDLAEKRLGRKAVPLPEDLENQSYELAARYGAAGDTRNTLDLYYLLQRELVSTGQWAVYHDIERPLVPLVASMERFGSPLDMDEVKRLREDYWQQEESIRLRILGSTGLDFGDDNDQRSYLSANGFHSSSLDKRVLSKINAPWVGPLLEYREVRTLRRNFLDKHLAEWKAVDEPEDYRAYPGFNQAGRDTESGSWINAPATGRFSSSSPNFQNQPRSIRSVFTAPKGYKFVSLDYSALELRVAADISEDPVMLSVLQEGGDLHQYMRLQILDDTSVDVGRPTAKTANFNLRYGGQADMLVTIAARQGAHLSYDLAKQIVETDRKTYTGYWKWFDDCIKDAVLHGYSVSSSGRRRYSADLGSSDQLKRGHAERAAANMVIQGSAADIIKRAMGRLIPILHYFKAHLAIQVHDELVFWVPEEVAERFVVAARGIMESIPLKHLALVVEGNHGENWAQVH